MYYVASSSCTQSSTIGQSMHCCALLEIATLHIATSNLMRHSAKYVTPGLQQSQPLALKLLA